jgi:cell division protein FtsL
MYLHDYNSTNYYSVSSLENVKEMTPFEIIAIFLLGLMDILVAALLGIMWKFHTRLLIVEMRHTKRD